MDFRLLEAALEGLVRKAGVKGFCGFLPMDCIFVVGASLSLQGNERYNQIYFGFYNLVISIVSH